MIKPDNKKVSKQFINYLKDTENLPLLKPQQQKQKSGSFEQPIKGNKTYGPVEGDFSKIGCTYVLENDKLTKRTLLYGRQNVALKESKICEQQSEGQNIETIKQIAKLEFLEKKGFLKPEQTKRLQKLRGRSFNVAVFSQKGQYREEMIECPKGRYVEFENEQDLENTDPNYYYNQGYGSPKKTICSMKHLPQQNYQGEDSYQPQYYQLGQSYNQNGSSYLSQANFRQNNYY